MDLGAAKTIYVVASDGEIKIKFYNDYEVEGWLTRVGIACLEDEAGANLWLCQAWSIMGSTNTGRRLPQKVHFNRSIKSKIVSRTYLILLSSRDTHPLVSATSTGRISVILQLGCLQRTPRKIMTLLLLCCDLWSPWGMWAI